MLSLDYLRNNIYNLSYFNPYRDSCSLAANVYRITHSDTPHVLDLSSSSGMAALICTFPASTFCVQMPSAKSLAGK